MSLKLAEWDFEHGRAFFKTDFIVERLQIKQLSRATAVMEVLIFRGK